MSPSVDIKTVRIMKMSSEEVGPPSPIDIDTPEEDQEEQEQKKKKKKKKKREEEREVSQHAKRKRRVEDEGPEVTEREPKRKKGDEMREGLGLDVVKECGEKKKKKKKLAEETIEGVGEDVANGGEKRKKKKKKKTLVEETIVVVQENLVSEGVKQKKKKKQKVGADTREGIGEDVFNGREAEKKKTVVEETIEVVEQNLVSEGQEKKKKKKKKEIIEESLEVVEQNLGSEGVEKKNKKKKKKEATEETTEVVEQNLGSKGEEKKKMKKKKQKVVETSMGGLVLENLVNEGAETPKKKKKKEVIEETMKMVVVNKSVAKKKKQKVVEQSMKGAQENVVNEGRENKKKRKKSVKPRGEGLPESRGEVAAVNGEVEKTTPGTTQEAKGKKERVRKVDHTTLPEDLLDLPDVKEILEFIPNVRSRIVLEKFRLYDLHRFRQFKKQGIPIRKGRCTAEEKQQIMNNVKDFMALTGISSAQELFFPHRSKDQCKEIKKLRAQHCLIQKIGEGLHRPCLHVYNLARKMIDEFNHMGRFNDEEDDMLQRLQTRHGNNWQEISKRMDRSTNALQKRFSHIASQHGAWESDEEKRLEQAMRAHLETLLGPHQTGTASGPWLTQEQLSKNLPWKSISKKVQTRSWSQCREKWFTILKPRMASDQCPAFSGGVKAVKAKVKLINTLYNMDIEDPALIDWDEVAITIGEVSDYYVRKSFHRLKVSCVPMASQMSYPEIIDYLQEKTLPKLKEYLRVTGDTELPCQDKFLLSHIFSS